MMAADKPVAALPDLSLPRVADLPQGPADLNQTDFFGALTLAQWSEINEYNPTTRTYRRTDR
jgi:hypothetical protein